MDDKHNRCSHVVYDADGEAVFAFDTIGGIPFTPLGKFDMDENAIYSFYDEDGNALYDDDNTIDEET